MTRIDIMLDLETWGKKPGCDIRSIGAVVFDPVAGMVGNVTPVEILNGSDAFTGWFYIATENPTVGLTTPTGNHWDDVEKVNRLYPLQRDPETVDWWSKQSPEAQSAFENPVDLWKACYSFRNWIWKISKPTERFENWEPSSNIRIWANGPQFDVSMLQAVFDAVGLPVPWHYRAPRDFRTITDAAGMSYDEFCNYGDAHNALHDAIAQAMTVCEAYKRLGLNR